MIELEQIEVPVLRKELDTGYRLPIVRLLNRIRKQADKQILNTLLPILNWFTGKHSFEAI